jgi:hypothetical protein
MAEVTVARTASTMGCPAPLWSRLRRSVSGDVVADDVDEQAASYWQRIARGAGLVLADRRKLVEAVDLLRNRLGNTKADLDATRYEQRWERENRQKEIADAKRWREHVAACKASGREPGRVDCVYYRQGEPSGDCGGDGDDMCAGCAKRIPREEWSKLSPGVPARTRP